MILLHNALIVDPEAEEVTPGALLMHEGEIAERFDEVDPDAPRFKGAQVVDCGGKHLAPGIVDLGVKICEPGERHKESFRSGGRAAARGGVTTMVTRPDTDPAMDNPETLSFHLARAKDDAPVRVLPMAALTKGRAGREMTEIGFLKDAGAVAFTDCDNVVADTKVLSRALTYAAGLDALVIGHPQEPIMSKGACMTSGQYASQLGLPAVSTLAERMGLERDLALVEATGVRYHADQITCRAGLDVLRRAQAAGLKVTAGTSIHHLTLNELDVADYRTFFKVKPPLRPEGDRLALLEAVIDGEIGIISSMHTPQDEESKRLPFEEAASGAVALETLLPAALQLVHSGHLELPALFRALALNPARLLGLQQGNLDQGAPADIILFDTDVPYQLDRWTLASKSKNTPYDLRRMQGRVLRTFVAGQQVFGDAI
ncbi:dihydroorotase [Pontivivens insulae]|uniref:Dihydroorotase n=1 Tax=Pontivivens insulae TaxID=1639689 RepID=A0A2R8A7N8_9RHOB|nr:dihydroorotase [Pontivivens insulae]RED18324.1 dihydroorotase [Pontivivens insulae]SPF28222.1 Dihydroorotase [Pontivivens insulae]